MRNPRYHLRIATALFAIMVVVQLVAAVTTASWEPVGFAFIAAASGAIAEYSGRILEQQNRVIRSQQANVDILITVNRVLRDRLTLGKNDPQFFNWEDGPAFHDRNLSERFYSIIDPND